ncbi:MAG: radical SAM protein [Candidatus Gastranaerophilales bacterium]|nr:radical SAM protein [Candidatus Gastranaerophilales bacterium]
MNKSQLFDNLRKSYSFFSEYNFFNYMLPPVRYFLELTYRCNLNCSFCFINGDRKKNEMTKDEWFNIINQIPFYSFISIVAGEVMIRPDFFDILEKASKKTFGKVSIITNGLLLNEENIKLLIKHNLLLLSVSIDGYKKNHDEIRNKKGLFDNIINNLELLNEIKLKEHKTKPLLDIKSVILENNLDDLPKIYKEAARLNAEFYSLSFKRNNFLRQNSTLKQTFSEEFYKDEYPLEMYFDREHFIQIYKELESISKNVKTKLRWAPKFKETGDLDRILKFFTLGNKNVNEIYHACNIPFSSVFITPEGDLYPCLSFKLGNIRNEKIQKVLNKEAYKNFRKQLQKDKIYNACQLCCDAYPKTNF